MLSLYESERAISPCPAYKALGSRHVLLPSCFEPSTLSRPWLDQLLALHIDIDIGNKGARSPLCQRKTTRAASGRANTWAFGATSSLLSAYQLRRGSARSHIDHVEQRALREPGANRGPRPLTTCLYGYSGIPSVNNFSCPSLKFHIC